MKKLLILIFIPLVSISIILNGCGKKDSTQTSGNKTEQVQNQPENVQQVNPDKNKMGEPSGTGTNELGIIEGIPKDYPSDIPQPKNSKPLGFLNTSEGTVVTFETDEMPMSIVDQFKSDLDKSGFKKDEGEMVSNDGGLVLWKKATREVSLMIARDKDKNKTSAVVTYK